MAREQVIASLDIGNAKIRCIIAVVSPSRKDPHIVGIGYSPSLGLRDGVVSSIEEVVSNIEAAVQDAERMSGFQVQSVFVGTSGPNIESVLSRGVVAIANKEITESDVARAIEAAQNTPLNRNAHVLRVIPKNYTVDDQYGIQNPLGMAGIRLEVEAHVITGNVSILKNLEKSVHQSNIDIEDIIPAPIAIAESVLTRRQKELGIVIVDIGASSTSVAVYEEGVLLHTAILPIGGNSVTKDIAIGLRSSIDAAEKLKMEYGTNIVEEVRDDEDINLEQLSKIDSHIVSRKHLSEIIQARYYEIFLLVKDELRRVGRDGRLPGGACLSGAAVKMPGTLELAREVLSLPVQIGFPQNIQGMIDQIDDPSFATAVGLIHWGIKNESSSQAYTSSFSFDFSGMFSWVGKMMKKLLP